MGKLPDDAFGKLLERENSLQRALARLAEAGEALRNDCPPAARLERLEASLDELSAQGQGLQAALEESLREARMLRTIADNTSDTLVIKDLENRFIFANPAALALFGCSAEELLASKDTDWVDAESIARMREQERRVLETYAPVVDEQKLRLKGGPEGTYSITKFPFFGPDGAIAGIVAAARDVTARKREEEALARLATIVELTSDAVLTIEVKTGTIQYANPAAENLLGAGGASIVGQAASSLVSNERVQALGELGLKLARGEDVPPYETIRVGALGEVREFSVGLFPIRNGAHEVFAYGAILRDVTERKRAERALRQSQAFLSRTLDALSASIAMLDHHGDILAVNEAWRNFADANGLKLPKYGVGANYLAISRAAAYQGDPAAAEALAGLERVLGGEQTSFRLAYPCHSPEVRRWFLMIVTCFGLEGNTYTVVAHENITEQKLAEETLRNNEARISRLLEALPDPILAIDAQGTIVLANEQAERIFGYPHAELLGRPVETLVPEPLRQIHREGYARFFRLPYPRVMGAELDLYALRKDGGTFPVEVSLSPLDTPEGPLVVASVRDVTQRRQSELAASRLAAIVASSQDAIYSWDFGGTVLSWNQGCEKIYGYSAAEVLGKPLLGMVPRELQDDLLAKIARLRRGETIPPFETERVRKDGTHVAVLLTLSPIKDPRGQTVAISTIAREITQLKETLEELARQKADLAAAHELDELKDHFLSTLSHEMRTPLSLITGYAELLEDRFPGDPMLEGIQDGSRRLADHINNMLDYSAMISGKLKLDRTEVWLPEIIQHAVAAARDCYTDKHLTVQCGWPEEFPVMQGDFRRLAQILHELIDNAQKFSPPGAPVDVEARCVEGRIHLSVCDKGPGISEEDRQRIWKAFTQLDVRDAMRKGGLGLGLTIVKKLAELHGGHAEVSSAAGQGSCFTVVLPLA